jgi:hypothetical protein
LLGPATNPTGNTSAVFQTLIQDTRHFIPKSYVLEQTMHEEFDTFICRPIFQSDISPDDVIFFSLTISLQRISINDKELKISNHVIMKFFLHTKSLMELSPS